MISTCCDERSKIYFEIVNFKKLYYYLYYNSKYANI